MQESFGFVADDLAFIRRALTDHFGALAPFKRAAPVWKLVRSIISSRTLDAVTDQALARLKQRWPDPASIAAADPSEVLRLIETVTFPEDKAQNLVAAMRKLGRERPDYDLGFLAHWRVRDALDWLERFPGVGAKVSAATLNASALAMPVFIVDSHVHRILLRFGFIGAKATAEQGRDAVTASGFDAEQLLDLFVRMKKLGQQVCHPSGPDCGNCPLASRCARRIGLGRPTGAFVPFKSRPIAPRVAPFPGGPRLSG